MRPAISAVRLITSARNWRSTELTFTNITPTRCCPFAAKLRLRTSARKATSPGRSSQHSRSKRMRRLVGADTFSGSSRPAPSSDRSMTRQVSHGPWESSLYLASQPSGNAFRAAFLALRSRLHGLHHYPPAKSWSTQRISARDPGGLRAGRDRGPRRGNSCAARATGEWVDIARIALRRSFCHEWSRLQRGLRQRSREPGPREPQGH